MFGVCVFLVLTVKYKWASLVIIARESTALILVVLKANKIIARMNGESKYHCKVKNTFK